jgi:hypothetical protein
VSNTADELGEFIRDMRCSPTAEHAVYSEDAHERARDWAAHVSDKDDGPDYDEAYRAAYNRIAGKYFIVDPRRN